MRLLHALAQTLALGLLVPLLSGCVGHKPTVALLIADGSSATSGAVDVDAFEERVQSTCKECTVKLYDAEGAAAQQKSQTRQALAESADVLVVVPIEPEEVESATQGDVPLISLGSLVPGSDGHVGLEGDGDLARDGASDLDVARDLVLGKRDSMTYVPTIEMSEQAADVAVALLAGDPVSGGEQVEGVRSWLYPEQKVTLDTLTTVLVGQGVLTLDELCEGVTAGRCERIGLR